ncbi:MAG: hypothetical protein ACYCS4_12860 [Acidimicrobiales bacterium]
MAVSHLLDWRDLVTERGEDAVASGAWGAICSDVADSGVAPDVVAAHLDLRALSWERSETKADDDTIPISTIQGFKGGAQKIIIGYHDERVPPSARPSPYEDLDPDEMAAEGLALAYVEASRAEDVHLSLCIKRPGCYHHPPLAGWEYLQRR